jgi:hypothetical protein
MIEVTVRGHPGRMHVDPSQVVAVEELSQKQTAIYLTSGHRFTLDESLPSLQHRLGGEDTGPP